MTGQCSKYPDFRRSFERKRQSEPFRVVTRSRRRVHFPTFSNRRDGRRGLLENEQGVGNDDMLNCYQHGRNGYPYSGFDIPC